MGCCARSCSLNYHFVCAKLRGAVFQDDMQVFCHMHHDRARSKVSTGSNKVIGQGKVKQDPREDKVKQDKNKGKVKNSGLQKRSLQDTSPHSCDW